MKRYIRLLGVLLILFSSCSDFLEEKSQDLIIPKSVKDYREFLFGEAYIRDETQIHTYLDIMTDDVKENIKGSSVYKPGFFTKTGIMENRFVCL